ncbi:hypothetical protein HELRODRAFT_194575 [Helobdella robusta]|uniref:von Hippel-Lindau disease tumour suppressor beta domain-containing protein n=1 Tax=Helobdella robusta TaxID=6412 RepID=T1FW76_HELRO|nr:hypothetical protein HELRODRAFT_194575 [Helobdella robusta]ESN91023.1 hypothetical protein HELRODRAFT_194575 [Helobdella robusta]
MGVEKQVLRSTKSQRVSFVRFVNQVKRLVAIFWINFEGIRVRYTQLNYGDHITIYTYVGHPWAFADADNDEYLVTSKGEEYYMPKPCDGKNVETVFIRLPVYSLRECCLTAAKKYYLPEELQSMLIPDQIKFDLRNDKKKQANRHASSFYFNFIINERIRCRVKHCKCDDAFELH